MVSLDKKSPGTNLADLFSHSFTQPGPPSGDDQVCALAGKQQGGGFANTRGGTCDDGNLPR